MPTLIPGPLWALRELPVLTGVPPPNRWWGNRPLHSMLSPQGRKYSLQQMESQRQRMACVGLPVNLRAKVGAEGASVRRPPPFVQERPVQKAASRWMEYLGESWTLLHAAVSAGDTVYLAHVICDARTHATAVGSSAAATQWTPYREEQVFAKVLARCLICDCPEGRAQCLDHTHPARVLACSSAPACWCLLHLRARA